MAFMRLVSLATWLISITLITSLSTIATAAEIQDTIYNYSNRTTYIHIQNDDMNAIIPFQFNSKFSSGDAITNQIELPSNNSKVISVDNELYAIYGDADSTGYITLALYNSTTEEWSELSLEDEVEYLYQSSYLHTLDDVESIYIYGGYNSTSSTISNRLIRLDLTELKIYDASSSVTPSAFYHSSNLLINYNTQLLVGGKASSGWVSLKQLALWQYEAWAFKSVSVDADDTINSRTGSLLLPIFNSDSMNQDYISNNFSDFSVDSVLMIGGELTSDSYSSPNFARLDVSSSAWSWDSLDTTISLANSKTNNYLDDSLSLEDIIGAAVIYDTLLVVANNTGTISTSSASSSSKLKRDDSVNYYIKLYNTTTFEQIDNIDYTSLNDSKSSTKSNKSLIIVLSVLLPLLAVIIIIIVAILLYKKYKKTQADIEKEKDLQNIMEFYNGAGNPSTSSLGSDCTYLGSTDEKDHPQHRTDTFLGQEVKVNDFEDGDNLSISSWRRKREMFEKEKQKRLNFIPHLPTRTNTIAYQPNHGDTTGEYDEATGIQSPMNSHQRTFSSPGSALKRSFSSISNNLGRSLRRNLSYQSSIRTFVTAETSFSETPEDVPIPEQLSDQVASNTGSILRPPQKTLQIFTQHEKSNSTLYLIPEDSSLSDFTSKRKNLDTNSVLSQSTFVDAHENISSAQSEPSNTRQDLFSEKSKSGTSPMNSSKRFSAASKGSLEMMTPPTNISSFEDVGDDEDLENLDVQVLVSSKRRSKLRVINPDDIQQDSEEDDESDFDEDADFSVIGGNIANEEIIGSMTTRKRVVSDEKNKDYE
ncbi:hypothetical protein CANARDRAFT_8775 [[Candida] arabinofermentans NRRL YB-2248]|uniref:Galactose oxidase n=1 Tax=[Candida] arabinofermentans NRRL YB-2248 TaxID=983967 RepID=A0A1E4SY46_9ASCO|nr:hypothetical protein CANARDRAFT_8775 [[Candida] arabinofermentans NRRL YB-2248]